MSDPMTLAGAAASPNGAQLRTDGDGDHRADPPIGGRRGPDRHDVGAGFPEIIIEARPGWQLVDWRELYDHRDLLRYLTRREIRARYAQSVLGLGWAIIQPVASALVFTVVFGRLAGVGSDGLPYGLFAFCGLILWTFFSGALASAAGSLIHNAAMLDKVYFPRLVLPLSAVAAKLVDLVVNAALLAALMAWYGVAPGPAVVWLPVLLAVMLLAALGMGLWLGALAVQYRDVAHGLGFAIQILMYLSPVIYPASLVPNRFRWLYGLNPMAGVIEGTRAALLGSPAMPWDLILVGGPVAVALAVTGTLVFRRRERLFADVA
jgi:lipopolysaccharide transport system permease protein